MNRLLPLLLILLLAFPASADTYAGRADVAAFIAEMQARHGFDRDALEALFAKTRLIPNVIKAILPPPEPGIRSWQT